MNYYFESILKQHLAYRLKHPLVKNKTEEDKNIVKITDFTVVIETRVISHKICNVGNYVTDDNNRSYNSVKEETR